MDGKIEDAELCQVTERQLWLFEHDVNVLQMYEKALATNQRLKSRLEISKQELAMIQDQLQRAQVNLQSIWLFSTKKKKKVVVGLIKLIYYFPYCSICIVLICCHNICRKSILQQLYVFVWRYH